MERCASLLFFALLLCSCSLIDPFVIQVGEESESGYAVTSIAFSEDGQLMATTHRWMRPPSYRSSGGGAVPEFFHVTKLGEYRKDPIATLSFPRLYTQTLQFRRGTQEISLLALGRHCRWTPDSYECQDVSRELYELSPDGNYAAGNFENLENPHESKGVYAFDLDQEKIVAELPRAANAICFSNDGEILVTNSRMSKNSELRAMQLWDWRSRRLLRQIPLSEFDGSHLTFFSPNSRQLLVHRFDKQQLELYSVEDGRVESALQYPEGFQCLSIAFSLDGNRVAASGYHGVSDEEESGIIYVWDVANGRVLESIPDKSQWAILSVAFTPNGKYIAAGMPNGEIKFWRDEWVDWPVRVAGDEELPSPLAASTGLMEEVSPNRREGERSRRP